MLALVVVGALCVVPAAPVHAAATGKFIVTVVDGQDPMSVAQAAGAGPSHVYRAAITGFSAALTTEQVSRLSADSRVESVVPDQLVHLTDGTDPQRPTPELIPFGVKRIGTLASPTAHPDHVDDPMNVDIAIIDTGIGPHPDLRVAGGTNCADGSGYNDTIGHGTHVAGTAAAMDNGFGFIGVAPGARLWAVRVIDRNGDGSLSETICGIDWVTAHADTIEAANMSLAFDGRNDADCGRSRKHPDPLHAAICRSVAAGVTYVASAGNDATNLKNTVPAAYDQVITVSAMTDLDGLPGGLAGTSTLAACPGEVDDTFASFTNFGETVDLTAPGVCVASTWPTAPYYVYDSGTSMAAPHVTGAAALYLVTHSHATPEKVRHALVKRAEHAHLGNARHHKEPLVNVAGL